MGDSRGKPGRPIVVELSTITPTQNSAVHRRTRKSSVHKRGEESDDHEFKSLDLAMVMRTVKEYGKRTHAIGALSGAHALQDLIRKVRELSPSAPDIDRVLNDGELSVRELKSYIHKVYED